MKMLFISIKGRGTYFIDPVISDITFMRMAL